MLTLRCLLWFSNVDLRQIGSGSKGVVELPQWGQSTVWMYQASIAIPCVVFPTHETLTVIESLGYRNTVAEAEADWRSWWVVRTVIANKQGCHPLPIYCIGCKPVSRHRPELHESMQSMLIWHILQAMPYWEFESASLSFAAEQQWDGPIHPWNSWTTHTLRISCTALACTCSIWAQGSCNPPEL